MTQSDSSCASVVGFDVVVEQLLGQLVGVVGGVGDRELGAVGQRAGDRVVTILDRRVGDLAVVDLGLELA